MCVSHGSCKTPRASVGFATPGLGNETLRGAVVSPKRRLPAEPEGGTAFRGVAGTRSVSVASPPAAGSGAEPRAGGCRSLAAVRVVSAPPPPTPFGAAGTVGVALLIVLPMKNRRRVLRRAKKETLQNPL